MYILHLSATPLAGAPVRLCKILNKYSNTFNKSALSLPTGIQFDKADIMINYHYASRNVPVFHDSEILFEEIKKADIIHIHNYPPINKNSYAWELIKKKPVIVQFHSPPHISKPRYDIISSKINIKKILVIGQYHARVLNFPNKKIVRNVVDIYHPLMQPKIQNNNPPIITYAPSNTRGPEMKWAYKSYNEILELFDKLRGKYICHIFTNIPWNICLKERQIANFHIDEIHTGSYHLSSLEGLSQGKVVIANLAEWMIEIIKELTGCTDVPWLICNKNNIEFNINSLAANKDKLLLQQKLSREWMEKYWTPELIINDYLEVYNSL